MGDFHQNGVITTLHNLTRRPVEELESDLLRLTARNPVSLVLPSLYSELEADALDNIVTELSKAKWISEIVIGLDRADEKQFAHAREYFSRLPQHHRILWNDGPRLKSIDARLKDLKLAPGELGKGCNVWYCFGYVLASGRAAAVGLHDCDIVTYDRNMVARLFYPVVHPAFGYQFAKGYYARIAGGHMNGRVARLLVTPLLRALKQLFGDDPFLEHLDSFRYPLAGEFSMDVDVLRDLRIPSDWGLEIGVLSEMQRNLAPRQQCQVDIADVYDHKHQKLSAGDPNAGLARMAADISKALFRKLATQGHVFSAETFRTIKATYYRIALDFVGSYYEDAVMNGLSFDRHAEEGAVETFIAGIVRAGEQFLANPMETPFIPSWNRVTSAMPEILEELHEAVEEDNN